MSDIDLINQQPRRAHPNSIKLMRNLSKERDDTAMVQRMPEQWKALYYAVLNGSDDIVHKDVDTFITQLKKCPKQPVCGPAGDPRTDVGDIMAIEKWQQASKVTTPNPSPQEHLNNFTNVELQDGMYRRPSDGVFFKLYHTVHGHNVQVAKRLIITNQDTILGAAYGDSVKVKFKYEGRAPLRTLTHDMRLTLEEAKKFGALYGTCCICGRTLTNELSIHIGIGPVCGRRQFGGEFEFQIAQAKIELGDPCTCLPPNVSFDCPKHKHRVTNPVSKVDDVADLSDWDHYSDADQYRNGMSATGAPLSKQELEARLAEINQQLCDTDNARSNDYNPWERGE